MTGYNQSIYTEAYNVRTVPNPGQSEWKNAPADPAPAARNPSLSPRAKAAVATGALVLAATGAFAWSSYASAQADAQVRMAQIALEQQKLDLQKAQQAADLAKSAGQETEAQRARREAVQACVNKAGGNFNAIADCGQAFPTIDTVGMQTASQTVPHDTNGSPVPVSGLVTIGALGAVWAVSWAKKRFPRT